MGKLNRPHGIEVGSKVRVLNDRGSSAYSDKIGKILTVAEVDTTDSYSSGSNDIIKCSGCNGKGQFPDRFELVEEDLPTNFLFKHKAQDIVYVCHIDRNSAIVSWVDGEVGAGQTIYATSSAEQLVQEGTWVIVPEATLPSKFLFKVALHAGNNYDPTYKMTKVATGYACTLANETPDATAAVHSSEFVEDAIKNGSWIIVDEAVFDKAIEDAEANYQKVMDEAIQRVRKAKEDKLNYLKEQA